MCPFRADSAISRPRVEEMVQTACEQAVCQGFYARHAGDTTALRLAARLDWIHEIPPPTK